MFLARLGRFLPSWKNALPALLSAVLLILAFPDFEYWFLAWFALVPLMWAVERQSHCVTACFLLGWLFGTAFFFGTCWWLTYAPIHYAGFPWPLAYFLILIACLGAGIFSGIFAAVLASLLRRFGSWAFLAAPFIWVFSEFLRYWLTGNNWNAIGYSQAFTGPIGLSFFWTASLGGVLLTSWLIVFGSALLVVTVKKLEDAESGLKLFSLYQVAPLFAAGVMLLGLLLIVGYIFGVIIREVGTGETVGIVMAVQPNVPMSGLNYEKWQQLRQHQIELAESAVRELPTANRQLPITVILPESPMNFMWDEDPEFQEFMKAFASRNNVSVLFNSAEPDRENRRQFNSAVLISPEGREVAQYDKIYLLPFGEAVPVPLDSIVPAFVGNFSYGKDYKLVPLGDAKAGIMICFESHFGQLSREYVRRGADVIIEMTNDGYLGPTPVLRQHLANAVFRAVETNRPVLRVTNVGITAYINERGQVIDPLPSYTEGTRVWSVAKSDGTQTFYVRYGDWFAWLCSVVTLVLLVTGWLRRGLPPSRSGSSATLN